MSEFTDLIARLEAAPEGNRELDKAIRAILPGETWDEFAVPLHYTTSTDAALTLKPEGWYLEMRTGYSFGKSIVMCLKPNESATEGRLASDGHTLPLAVCIEILRAREGE